MEAVMGLEAVECQNKEDLHLMEVINMVEEELVEEESVEEASVVELVVVSEVVWAVEWVEE